MSLIPFQSHCRHDHFRQHCNDYVLLLVDVRMPGMNGFELYREIRNVDAVVKACFITAFETYRRDLTPALDEVKCFVKKPIAMADLIKKLNAILES